MQSAEVLIGKAAALKAEGNALFQAGEFSKAATKYKLMYFQVGTLGSKHKEHRAILDGRSEADGAAGGGGGDLASALGSKRAEATAVKLAPEEQRQVDEILAATYANLAQTQINMKKFSEALKSTKIALLYSPQNPKVFYRQGLAYLNIGLTDEAKVAFQKTLELVPSDENAAQRLNETYALEKAKLDKQRQAMKAMFS